MSDEAVDYLRPSFFELAATSEPLVAVITCNSNSDGSLADQLSDLLQPVLRYILSASIFPFR